MSETQTETAVTPVLSQAVVARTRNQLAQLQVRWAALSADAQARLHATWVQLQGRLRVALDAASRDEVTRLEARIAELEARLRATTPDLSTPAAEAPATFAAVASETDASPGEPTSPTTGDEPPRTSRVVAEKRSRKR